MIKSCSVVALSLFLLATDAFAFKTIPKRDILVHTQNQEQNLLALNTKEGKILFTPSVILAGLFNDFNTKFFGGKLQEQTVVSGWAKSLPDEAPIIVAKAEVPDQKEWNYVIAVSRKFFSSKEALSQYLGFYFIKAMIQIEYLQQKSKEDYDQFEQKEIDRITKFLQAHPLPKPSR